MDKIYEYSGEESVPLLLQIRIALHLFFCAGCAREYERFEAARDVLKNDFFPPARNFDDPIMTRICSEDRIAENSLEAADLGVSGEFSAPDPLNAPGGLSTRVWVIIGLAVLFSLATLFFGLNFNKLADTAGMSFLLPIGITIGVVLTGYGAFFIGSHLKELSERFGLR
jgi:hypothetical protein